MRRWSAIVIVVLTCLLGIAMFLSGLAKVLGSESVVDRMAALHVEGGWLVAQGVLEMLLAGATIVPRTRNLGLLGLIAVFVGAVGAHLGAGQGISDAAPATAVLVATIVLFTSANYAVLRALVSPVGTARSAERLPSGLGGK